MLDKLGDEIKKEIRQHALDEFPKECCGLIVPEGDGYKIVKCRNLLNAENKFLVDPEIFNHDDNRNFTTVYHSHTHEKYVDFSEEDELMSNKISKDFLMYNVVNDTFKYYKYKNATVPILNRIFFPPILDHVTLVIDYYKQVLNIDFKIKNHYPNYLNGKLLDFFIDNGYKEVNSAKKHDIILAKKENQNANSFFKTLIVNSEDTFISYEAGLSRQKGIYEIENNKSEKIFMRHASML